MMGAVTKIWDATMEVARDGDIRSSHRTVDAFISVSDMTPSVIALCKELFERCSNLYDSKFTVERVSGGITNLLLKVSAEMEGRNFESVAVRMYGPNTECAINRQREFHMSLKV